LEDLFGSGTFLQVLTSFSQILRQRVVLQSSREGITSLGTNLWNIYSHKLRGQDVTQSDDQKEILIFSSDARCQLQPIGDRKQLRKSTVSDTRRYHLKNCVKQRKTIYNSTSDHRNCRRTLEVKQKKWVNESTSHKKETE
jgi:hypothetical protein